MDHFFAKLSDAQRQAIVAFAAREGRQWKRKLRTCWMYANYSGHEGIANALQSVRNEFGPTWLCYVKIPR